MDADEGLGSADYGRLVTTDADARRRRSRHKQQLDHLLRRVRRPVRDAPRDPRHARARGPLLPRDRREARHDPARRREHALPRAPAADRGVRRSSSPASAACASRQIIADGRRQRPRRARPAPRGAPRLLLPAVPAPGARVGHRRRATSSTEPVRAEDRRAPAAARVPQGALERAATSDASRRAPGRRRPRPSTPASSPRGARPRRPRRRSRSPASAPAWRRPGHGRRARRRSAASRSSRHRRDEPGRLVLRRRRRRAGRRRAPRAPPRRRPAARARRARSAAQRRLRRGRRAAPARAPRRRGRRRRQRWPEHRSSAGTRRDDGVGVASRASAAARRRRRAPRAATAAACTGNLGGSASSDSGGTSAAAARATAARQRRQRQLVPEVEVPAGVPDGPGPDRRAPAAAATPVRGAGQAATSDGGSPVDGIGDAAGDAIGGAHGG